jgi:hypothetical protein
MADDGYLIGYENNAGNFVTIGSFNNVAQDKTQPIELVHSSSGKKISIDSTGVSTSDLSVGGVDFADKADLNSTGVLKSTQVPDLSITSVDVVADQTARLNLTAEEGDVAIQTDINETFVLSTNDPTVDSNWKKVQLDVVGAIDGQTITPGQIGTSSNRSNIFADDVGARSIADDYIYAGEFGGGTADDRLTAALSGPSPGLVVQLENEKYSSSRTVPVGSCLVGTISGGRVNGSHFDSCTITTQGFSRFAHIGLANGASVDADGTQSLFNHFHGSGSETITISGSGAKLTNCDRLSIVLTSSSTDCIVSGNSSVSVTDNGSGNVVTNNT